MTNDNNALERILRRLKTSKKNVLTLHRRPDGDSVGSNAALALALRSLGHSADIYCVDDVPDYLRFVPGAQDVRKESPDRIPWHAYTTFWALDMSAPDMIGAKVELPKTLPVVVIDHHTSNAGWGTENLIEEDQISTASVVYNILKRTDITITKDMATALLTGICTDSGFFKFIKDGRPLAAAAELIDKYGVDYQWVVAQIQSQLNIEDIRYVTAALSRLTVDLNKRVAIISLPYGEIVNLGEAVKNSHLLTGFIQAINGTDFGILVQEEKQGEFRVQFRSNNKSFDVAAIAAALGGGGHKNAAGATISAANMDAAIRCILAAV